MFRTLLRLMSRDISRLPLVHHQVPVLSNRHITLSRCISTSIQLFHIDGNIEKYTLSDAGSPSKNGPLAVDNDDIPAEEDLFRVKGIHQSGHILSRRDAIQILNEQLFISRQQAELMFAKEIKLKYLNRLNFQRVIELIQMYKISSPTVEQFPWMLAIPAHILRNKLDTLLQIKPRCVEDFIPLLRVTNMRLMKISCIMEADRDIIPEGNRIYYLAKKLQVEPRVICEYLSRRLFMLEIPAHTLMEGLETMLEYGISPTSIMRDLWAFRYNTKSMKDRLIRAKNSHKTKIMPWMVRCPESILQKSLRLAADEKKILGDNSDVYEYLSYRLGYDLETTKGIVHKHPVVARVRVTKIKEILDYLLNEAGFTQQDIAQVPRILSHGLETTKRRLDELKSIGCKPTSLVVVCKSKREYQKFVNAWLENRKKVKV